MAKGSWFKLTDYAMATSLIKWRRVRGASQVRPAVWRLRRYHRKLTHLRRVGVQYRGNDDDLKDHKYPSKGKVSGGVCIPWVEKLMEHQYRSAAVGWWPKPGNRRGDEHRKNAKVRASVVCKVPRPEPTRTTDGFWSFGFGHLIRAILDRVADGGRVGCDPIRSW